MTTELMYLTLTALATALMWVPYGMSLMLGQGIPVALGNRDDVRPLAPWAERAKRAHENAVANLIIFASLVLVAHAAGVSNGTVAAATVVYFWMRLAHYAVYTLGVPVLRTIVWSVAWACQLVLVWQLLAAA